MNGADRSTLPDRPAPDEVATELSHRPVYGGRYAIEAELGRGGMGRVLRARDLKLGRAVAVKVLAPGAHDEQQRLRFEQEARAAGALNHPNIVAVHDVGEHGGEPYIVSELLEGQTLRALLKDGPLAPERALDLARQLADGLAAAHLKGIIHRDLKPENLFQTNERRLKILDFGIAKLLPEAKQDGGARFSTDTGAILGTPAYMSPEQVRAEPADARSDVFACGAVVHEMLSGAAPFDRPTSVETAYAILHDAPSPLPDSGLARIVGRCLEKDPRARYPDAAILLEDLETIARGERITAGRRRRSLITVIAALMFASAVWLALKARNVTWTGPRQGRVMMAVADFANETAEKDLDSLSGMLITSLEQSRRLSVLTRSRMDDVLQEMGSSNDARIDERLGREMARKASAGALVLANVRRFGELYSIDLRVLDPEHNEYLFAALEQGQGKESIPGLIDRLSERVRSRFDEKPAEIRDAAMPVAKSTTANLEAYRHFFAGEQLQHRMHGLAAANEFEAAIKLDPDFALAHLRLAQVSEGSSTVHLERALQLADRLSEREMCSARALRSMLDGREKDALAQVKDCADRYPGDEWTENRAGDWAFHQGDLDAAETYLEKVRARKTPNDEAYHHLVAIWLLRGQVDRVVAAATQQASEHHELDAYDHLAWAQWVSGDRAAVEKTLVQMEQLFPGKWAPLRSRLVIHLLDGDPEKAAALLERPELANAGSVQQRLSPLAVQWARGRFRSALALVDEMASRDLEYASVFNLWKAWALVARGNEAGAGEAAAGVVRAEAAALRANPKHQGRFYPKRLFMLYCRLGDVEAASAMLDSHEIMPLVLSGATVRVTAARAHRQGRVSDEIAAYETLSGGDPIWRPDDSLRLGALYLNSQQPVKAIGALRFGLGGVFIAQRLDLDSFVRNFVFDWYRLGKAYESAGDPVAALETYRRVLRAWSDADPDVPELIDTRARVATLTAR